MYDFRTGDPIDESYVTVPEYPIQTLAVKREEVVRQAGRETGSRRFCCVRPARLGPAIFRRSSPGCTGRTYTINTRSSETAPAGFR
ncbi:hypothetical protein [Paenibacillus tyrfis]|uniref:hypothetical protein n=1 Tax=Paenibacillus tyrfis TaxID=1501230 RepID=UPI0024907CDF|nr:hypothetical protein [Paenibacillus tyrfis]